MKQRTTDLDEAIDAALDARRDPLSDEAVLAALALEPERFGEVARLAANVAALGSVPHVAAHRATRRGLRRHVPLALAALALFGVAYIAWWPKRERAERDSANETAPIAASESHAPLIDTSGVAHTRPAPARDRIASLELSVEVVQGNDVRRTALVTQPNGSRLVIASAARHVNGRIEHLVTSQSPLP